MGGEGGGVTAKLQTACGCTDMGCETDTKNRGGVVTEHRHTEETETGRGNQRQPA